MEKNIDNDNNQAIKPEELENEQYVDPETVEEIDADPDTDPESLDKRVAELEQELEKEKKEYLFLMAEFDNFRKRTLREKSELLKTASEQALSGMLPILDDFERGIKAAEDAKDEASVKEGIELIYNKFLKYLEKNGVKVIDPEDKEFDTEKHEAISAVPVQDAAQKGKIIDTVQKGYTINGKVMRHAKVVVGS